MDINHDLDEKLKNALTTCEQVPSGLNRNLEKLLQTEKSPWKISLWFLPGLANTCLWAAAALFIILFLESGFLQKTLLFWCFDMILSGVLLSGAAYHFTDIKASLSITISERRKKECPN